MKVWKFIKNQKGVGLPEVSMGIALLSILLSAVTGALNTSYDIFNYHEKSIYEQTQGTIIMARVERVLKQSTVIEAPLQKDINAGPSSEIRVNVPDSSQSYANFKRKGLTVTDKALVEVDLDNGTLSKTLSEPCIESLTFLRDVNDARIIYVNLEIKNPTEKSKVTKNFKVQKIIFADNVRSFVNG